LDPGIAGREKSPGEVLEASMTEDLRKNGLTGELYGDTIAYGGVGDARYVIRRQLIGSAVVGIGIALFAGLMEFRPAGHERSGFAPHQLSAAHRSVYTQQPKEHLAGLKQ
jgi:hypothetical protein